MAITQNKSHIEAYPDLYWQDHEITPYTHQMMLDLIKEETGYDGQVPAGALVLLKLYKMPEKTAGGIIIPEDRIDNDVKYNTQIGKVLAFGPAAYRRKDLFPTGPYVEIGSWCHFRRYQNHNVTDNKIDLALVYDDKLVRMTVDPSKIDTTNGVSR